MALKIRAMRARWDASKSRSLLQARVTMPAPLATAPRPSGIQKSRRFANARRACGDCCHVIARWGGAGSSAGTAAGACGSEKCVCKRLMPPHRARHADIAASKLRLPPSRTTRVVRVAPSILLPSLQFAAAVLAKFGSPGVEFRMVYGAVAPPGSLPQATYRAILRPGYLISRVAGSGAGLRLGAGSCRRV
jgi:hypothetical protein